MGGIHQLSLSQVSIICSGIEPTPSGNHTGILPKIPNLHLNTPMWLVFGYGLFCCYN